MTGPQFPVSVRWRGGKLAFAAAHGAVLRVTEPVAPDDADGYWAPEELAVGAAATHFVLALVAAAEREQLPVIDVSVQASETSTAPAFRFVASIETLPGSEAAVKAAAERCLPDRTDLQVRVHTSEYTATQRATSPG